MTDLSGTQLISRPRQIVATKLAKSQIMDGVMALAIFLGALWLFDSPPLVTSDTNMYDLGIAAYGGVRAADGFVPYVDSHTPYGPGQFYFRALIFGVFGTNLGVMLAELTVFSALFVAASYVVLRHVTAYVPAVVLSFAIGALAPLALHSNTASALVFMLVAAGCMLRYVQVRRPVWLALTGVAIGLIGTERWDFGIFSIAVFSFATVSLPYIQRAIEPRTAARVPPDRPARRLAQLLVPALLAALPFYAPVLLSDPMAILRSVRLAQAAGPYRTLPFPFPFNPLAVISGEIPMLWFLVSVMVGSSAFVFPLLGPINLLTIVVVLWRKRPGTPSAPLVLHTLVTTLCGGCLFLYGFSRSSDLLHMAPSAMFMFMSLPWLFWLTPQLRTTGSLGGAVLGRVLMTTTVLVVTLAVVFGVLMRQSEAAPTHASANPRLAGFMMESGAGRDYDALVAYITEHTRPGDAIFSGLMRHDKVHVNDVLIYFAADRHSGVRDYHMDPGTTTTREVQRQMIQDLQRHEVRLIVLADPGLPFELNLSRDSSGVFELDDYIEANYAPVERFGSYLVLMRRDTVDVSCATVAEPGQHGSVDGAVQPFTDEQTVTRDGFVKIEGWAATATGGVPLADVEVRVNGHAVPAVLHCLPRDDVAAVHGSAARYGGWAANVDLRDVPGVDEGPLSIEVDVIDRDGVRYRLPTSTSFEPVDVAPSVLCISDGEFVATVENCG